LRIGIDLGGTKIEGLLLDGDKEVARLRVPTPRGSYQAILLAIHNLIQTLEQQSDGPCSVGIGGPGSLNTQGLLRNSNTTELNGKPLLDDLQQLCQRSIRISNDANCFALSEALIGTASKFDTVFGVILGTGVGGAFIINREILVGVNHIGGEWGHNPLPWMTQTERAQNRPCYCGKQHCIETFLSGPGLQHSYQLISRQLLPVEEILAHTETGNADAIQVIETYEDQLARALASVINIVDPACIVLGGGLSNMQRLYNKVPRLWQRYIFSDLINTQLLPPAGGDSAGVLGAAWLWAE
jgi:fructokinase